MSGFKVLLQIAVRNLFASFLNLIIGGIVLVGTFCFVVGSSLIKNIDASMSRSITGSIGGHAQVFSANSKDDLALFNQWGAPDLAAIPNFAKVKQSLGKIENIRAIVPMGVSNAYLPYGNTVDQALEKLRAAINLRNAGNSSPELVEKIGSLKSHVRQMISVIQSGYEKFSQVSSNQATDPRDAEALAEAAKPGFWESFDRDPLNKLEFLENHIATLVPDADFAFLSYVGTDLDAFAKSFDRMQVIDGVAVPAGERGLLLSKYVYENQFKLKIAHRLDKINEALTEGGKTIAKDPDLRQLIKQNRTQVREIILQLDPISTRKATERLQKFLNSSEADLPKLLASFLDTDDANFAPRYEFFYDELVPLVELYRLRPGDVLTIKAFTKSGFVQSINLKVYGTFQFKGLEKSGLAGGMSLMDLMSFRDLYGYLTPDKLAEMKEIAKSTDAKIIDRDRAEAELFSGASVVEASQTKSIDDQKELVNAGKVKREPNRPYTAEEIENGVAINAALILKDPGKLDATMREVEEISKRDGLELKVLSWQKAAGNIGQFVLVAKIVLYVAVFIIFIVALVVINNAVMMATLQRIREIGTMRAIGAQRAFVLAMVMCETIFLGLVFGFAGTLLGSVLIKVLGKVGIPAGNEFLYFFFSGPRLYPTLGMGSVISAFTIIVVVTTISALYPALIATRVSPVQAMSSED